MQHPVILLSMVESYNILCAEREREGGNRSWCGEKARKIKKCCKIPLKKCTSILSVITPVTGNQTNNLYYEPGGYKRLFI